MTLKAALVKLGPILISIILLFAFFRNQDAAGLAEALRKSRWILVLWAGLLNLFLLPVLRAERFRGIIAALPNPGPSARLGELVRIMSATRVLNLILPVAAGETLRIVRLKKLFGYSAISTAAAVVMESVTEALAFAGIALVLLVFPTRLFGVRSDAIVTLLLGFIGLGTAVLVLVLLMSRTSGSDVNTSIHRSGKLKLSIRRFRDSLGVLNAGRVWWIALLWTLVVDIVDVAMVGLCLRAAGITLPIAGWCVLLVGINLAIAIPAPGHVGTLEAGAVLILLALGIERGPASVFALLYHAAHLFPTLILGSIALQLEFRVQPVAGDQNFLKTHGRSPQV